MSITRVHPASDPTTVGDPHNPAYFREVLGHFPTGVVVVTAISPDGPVGMAVGSFTSVSLDPPMVAFLPDRSSSTFPHIRAAGAFCVNVLAADQVELCRGFAQRGADKFAGVEWDAGASSGAPRLAGAVAWLECRISAVHDAGDHFIVVGEVEGLGLSGEPDPLLFFQGGYGRFSSFSLAMTDDAGMMGVMRRVEVVRPRLEVLAAELDMEAVLGVRDGQQMLVVASARTSQVHGVLTRVGQRIPLASPLSPLLVVCADEATRTRWLDAAPGGAVGRAASEALLERVRRRGWSVGLMSDSFRRFDEVVTRQSVGADGAEMPDEIRAALAALALGDADLEELDDVAGRVVRNISAPVYDAEGGVLFVVSLVSERHLDRAQLLEEAEWIRRAAARMSEDLVGQGLT